MRKGSNPPFRRPPGSAPAGWTHTNTRAATASPHPPRHSAPSVKRQPDRAFPCRCIRLTIFPCLQNSRRSAPKVWTTLPPPPTHARRWARASWSYIPAAPRSSHERRRWPTPPTRWKRPASSSQTRVRTCGWGWKRWASRTSSARSMKCCACAGSRPRSSRRSSISAI